MRNWRNIRSGTALALFGILASVAGQRAAAAQEELAYTDTFFNQECEFKPTGSNPYFILEPGYQTVFESNVDGEHVVLTITVLHQMKEVNGIKTRVVKEMETVEGGVAEVAWNYFAICEPTNSVFYFGEDVDIYDGGEVVSHDGAWLAGQDGARPGIIMPGTALLGARYYQEIAPEVALDRAEIMSLTEQVDTPAGHFENVLETRETTDLEPDAEEFKWYARGVGLIQDSDLVLTHYGFEQKGRRGHHGWRDE